MSEPIEIQVLNQLIEEKRDVSVYHHSSRSAHIIGRSGSLTLPLQDGSEDDYLHISLVSGPGNLWKGCLLDVPAWADLEFSFDGSITMTHRGKRTLFKIPPGPPTWQLRLSRPAGAGPAPDRLTIGEAGPGGED